MPSRKNLNLQNSRSGAVGKILLVLLVGLLALLGYYNEKLQESVLGFKEQLLQENSYRISLDYMSMVFGMNMSLKLRDVYPSRFNSQKSALCPDYGRNMKLLIAVISEPKKFYSRDVIRKTWGYVGSRRDLSLGFFLGETENKTLQQELDAENSVHGDLVQGGFKDDYYNLTLKVMSILEWQSKKCSNIRYVLKVDDDVFLNVPMLLTFIDQHWNTTRAIFGHHFTGDLWADRDKTSKYYISESEYAGERYPFYIVGPAYLMSSDFISDLYELALKSPFFKFEDIYFTGFLASQTMKIKLIHQKEFVTSSESWPLNDLCEFKTKVMAYHKIQTEEILGLWKKLLVHNDQLCKKS